MHPINLAEKFAQFHDHWHPRIIGELNDQYVKIAKIEGAFIWHSHAQEDELFVVIEGKLLMDFRDRTVEVTPGELLIVPRGVEHRPRTEGETRIMLIEPKTTVNTGAIDHARTRKNLEKI